ncbi:cold-responsive protein kinase 1-like isoform X2 [Phragmites australis]|uniref:cold-responsive protein kinase 1-like isoform X2 n=1 Tax=Phragmites australis TaxID=29695 RepID=UPI002D77D0B5|nr:cold-responsive protein kinase 1-like isoform X2 [Phragmites australis]XP_062204026.1 cold-responsive protein kinase 1-like isoform X2 [Phragmites australis]
MACFPVFRRKKNSRSQIVQHGQDIPIAGNVKIYSSKEMRKATRNFSPRNILGQGSFGCVYMGKLQNGEKVAIKVLSSQSRQGTKEFLNELSVISNITHHNLVKLHGCSVDGGQKMLVYNYLENNSLAQTLFGNAHSGIVFDWKTRVKICIGVADGLAYLHEEVRPPIVHRDIKASNILLDSNLSPKIADFGLAKLFPGSMTHISTRVAGTLGYLAPEYAIRGQLTKKADVYSFGVLLLEIISGRCHTDPRLPLEDQYLLEKVWTLYESTDLDSIIDRTLKRDFDNEEAHRLLKIGLLCTQDTSKIRPSMSTVAKMLKGECALSDRIMRPGLITDVMDLKIRTVEAVQLSLSPFMSPAAESNSLVSTLALAGSTVVEKSP